MSASWGRTCVERTFERESDAIAYEDKLALEFGCPGFLVWTERVTLGRGTEVSGNE